MGKTRTLSTSLQHMTHVLRTEDVVGLSDAELVRRFVKHRDEAAFGVLVRRYGIIVLGVCRRVLHHEQDAEDAFQATFLILAQKAASVRRAEEIGNWLYGVAYNVARKAKAYRYRREVKERLTAAQQSAAIPADMPNELQEILDHELYALTDKYRTPIVLCDLRGFTIQEAAAELGCPPKTLGTRLSRGRALLAGRLTKRGVVISMGGLIAALSTCSTATAITTVSPRLLGATICAAVASAADSTAIVSPMVAALTKGVSNVMLLKSLSHTALLICCVLVSTGLVRHFSAQAATTRNAQQSQFSGHDGTTPGKKANANRSFSHLDHLMLLLDHFFAWSGIGQNDSEVATVVNADDKPTLSGIWILKNGDIEMKLDFSDKDVLKIHVHHGEKEGIITCDCTLEKESIVKGKITKVEGVESDKLPVGAEFKFKWKVKDNTAILDDVESEKAPIMKHLEGKFEQKK